MFPPTRVVFLGLCLLAGLSPIARCQQPPTSQRSPSSLETSRFRMPSLVEGTLDNGLRVIVCPRPSGGLVDVRVAVRVGTWLEGEYEGSGISHYFEHLVAGGATKSRTREECRRLVRSLGGVARATTDADRTWFHLTTTRAGMPQAVELMADWIRNCALDPEDVEREKSVILEEFDQYEDFDPRRAWELMHATAFSRHPARLPLQGFREQFERITREDLVKFHESMYLPGNVVVSVVGDVDPGRAFNQVRESFGDWRAARAREPSLPAEPPQTGRRRAWIEGVSSRASVAMGYRSVSLNDPDMLALDVLRYVVGVGNSASLSRRIVDVQGLASGLRVFSRTPALGGGLFAVTLQVRPEDVNRVEELVQEEFDGIAGKGVPQADFERAVRLIRAETVFGLERVEDLAQSLTRDELQTGNCRYTEAYLEQLARVSAEDLQRVAAKYLVRDQLTVAVVGPELAEDDAEAADDRPEPGGPREGAPLENGVRLRIWPQPGSGMVALHASLGGGSMAETKATHGAASLLAELLLRGGGEALSRELEEIEARGGSARASAGRWTVDLSVQVLREDLDRAMRFMVKALVPARFEPRAFDRARDRAVARAESRRSRYVRDAEDRLYAQAFAEHALGLRPGGTAESLAGLTAEALGEFSSRLLVGSNLVVGVVGDFDPEQVQRGLALLDRLPRGEPVGLTAPEPELAGPEPTDRSEPVLLQTDRSQATVVLAYRGVGTEAAEGRVALDLFDAYASGRRIPSGPLFEALRGENDLVYHVSASHRPHPGSGLFFILAQCSPANYQSVLAELEATVTRLASEGMTQEDLVTARNILLSSRQTTHQTASVRARMLATAGVYGLPVDSEQVYRQRVGEVGLDRVHEAVRSMLNGQRLLLLIWPEGTERP